MTTNLIVQVELDDSSDQLSIVIDNPDCDYDLQQSQYRDITT